MGAMKPKLYLPAEPRCILVQNTDLFGKWLQRYQNCWTVAPYVSWFDEKSAACTTLSGLEPRHTQINFITHTMV